MRAGTRDYWRAFFTLVGAGLLGVLSLYPTLRPTAEALLARPDAPDLPLSTLQAVLLVNPILLLVVSVAVGTALAPRLGLRSHLAETVRGKAEFFSALRPEIPRAVLWGGIVAIATLAIDAFSRPFLGEAGEILRSLEEEQPRSLGITLAGMLYGGITEELITRWGLVSLLAWALWRLFRRGEGRPRAWILWTAIVMAAVLFGAGHLGVVEAQIGLTAPMVVRTIALNAMGGIVFGWLFWRWSLEAAMIAHGSAHVVMTLLSRTVTLLAGG